MHARWLAADGYQVQLVDPVAEHFDQARAIVGVKASVGDARALTMADSSVDAALLLGPLYHLVDERDRGRALAEAMRVTRPGGLVAAAAISRYAALLELAALGELDADTGSHVASLIETGINDDPERFTTAYFHRPEQLAAELTGAGLSDVTVFGVEGPSAPALDIAGLSRIAELMPSAVRCAEMVETDPAMISASPHLLAFGRRVS